MSSAILSKLESFSSDISLLKKENIDLKKEINILRNSSCNLTPSSSVENPNMDIVQELKERELKCRNNIIFNA